MGKGDKKTRKGKIYAGSHGNVRPHSARSSAAVKATASEHAVRAPAKAPVRPAVRKAAPRKVAPKKSA